jgi:hypothetical protein
VAQAEKKSEWILHVEPGTKAIVYDFDQTEKAEISLYQSKTIVLSLGLEDPDRGPAQVEAEKEAKKNGKIMMVPSGTTVIVGDYMADFDQVSAWSPALYGVKIVDGPFKGRLGVVNATTIRKQPEWFAFPPGISRQDLESSDETKKVFARGKTILYQDKKFYKEYQILRKEATKTHNLEQFHQGRDAIKKRHKLDDETYYKILEEAKVKKWPEN